MGISVDALQQGFADDFSETDFDGLGILQRGKVRDSYLWGDRRAIVATDRLSAFDVILGTLPFKGQILNGISAYWFEQTADICPNHLLSVPDPAVSIVRECQPFPLEIVVRGYLTGSSDTSIWTQYAAGNRSYCGHTLADGMRQHQPLDTALITPTTKAAVGGHDVPISAAEVIAQGLATADEFDDLSAKALALFARGQRMAAERGLLLVDTKYEFGRDPEGRILVIDEVHTPDSSRYWYRDGYEQAMSAGADPRALDKEYLRRHLQAMGFSGQGVPPSLSEEVRAEATARYAETFAVLTGRAFTPDIRPARTRIEAALRQARQ